MFPATSIRHISRDLDVSLPSIRWHLKLLQEAGVVTLVSIGKFRVAFPEMLIDPQDVSAYALLNTENGWKIFNTILSSPGTSHLWLKKEMGMSTQNLSVWMRKFASQELIAVVKDGRRNRYFPTALLIEIEKRERERRNRFKKHILNKLNLDGVSPEVLESTGNNYTLRLHVAEKNYTLKLHLTPLKTIVEGRDAFFREMEAWRLLPAPDEKKSGAHPNPLQKVAEKISRPSEESAGKAGESPVSKSNRKEDAAPISEKKAAAAVTVKDAVGEERGKNEGLAKKLKKVITTEEEKKEEIANDQ